MFGGVGFAALWDGGNSACSGMLISSDMGWEVECYE